MIFFDMSDFMGDHCFNFIGLKHLKKTVGYEDISEFLYQSHYGGGDHSAAENRPVKNIAIFQAGFFTQFFNAPSMFAAFNGLASPELLNHGGTEYGDGQKKNQKISNFTFCGGEQLFGPRKRQQMDDVCYAGEQDPG